MSKKLVIVESPSKSKTIEKYLGKDYKVVSSLGHIRDLSTTGKYGLGIDRGIYMTLLVYQRTNIKELSLMKLPKMLYYQVLPKQELSTKI